MEKLSINTQQIDYDIYVVINNYEASCINTFNSCTTRPHPKYLGENEETKLYDLDLFKIEYYTHSVEVSRTRSRSNSNTRKKTKFITNEEKLLKSIEINKNLCPNQEWLQYYMKNTIKDSSFTIFINNKNTTSTYDPLCIATITRKKYNGGGDDRYKYLYVHAFCGSSEYTKCAYHLMNIIKLIAFRLECKYVKLESIGYEDTLKWYRSQGFKEQYIHKDTQNVDMYYQITSKDDNYNRSLVEGSCKIINGSPNRHCMRYATSSKKSKKVKVKAKSASATKSTKPKPNAKAKSK
jgi:hypothetical protein